MSLCVDELAERYATDTLNNRKCAKSGFLLCCSEIGGQGWNTANSEYQTLTRGEPPKSANANLARLERNGEPLGLAK